MVRPRFGTCHYKKCLPRLMCAPICMDTTRMPSMKWNAISSQHQENAALISLRCTSSGSLRHSVNAWSRYIYILQNNAFKFTPVKFEDLLLYKSLQYIFVMYTKYPSSQSDTYVCLSPCVYQKPVCQRTIHTTYAFESSLMRVMHMWTVGSNVSCMFTNCDWVTNSRPANIWFYTFHNCFVNRESLC